MSDFASKPRTIAVLPGDGIGPEVVAEGLKVLGAVSTVFGHCFESRDFPFGGAGLDVAGVPLPPETLRGCLEAEAVLLGAVGGPKWDAVEAARRPEKGLLELRKALGVYANLRPVLLNPLLAGASPLKEGVIGSGIDLVIVRELTGGLYFGPKRRGADSAEDSLVYTAGEIRRVARVAFDLASRRRGLLTSVDKANVLETSRLWRSVVEEVARDYPGVRFEHLYVDNCAMQLVRKPSYFDVILTENMFGDILSDLGGVLAASIGMLPSASLGEGSRGLYEPVHGSAPDIAGKGIANPIGTFLSVAMMLRLSFGLEVEAAAVEAAVSRIIDQGIRTADLGAGGLGTRQVGDAVAREVLRAS